MAEKIPEEVEFDKAKKYAGDTRSRMKTIYGKLKDAAANGDVDECNNLIVAFRSEAGKLPGIYQRLERALAAFKAMVEGGMAAPQASAVAFPQDLDALHSGTAETLDGAKVKRVTDASGQKWLVRNADDAESGGKSQLESECAVDAIYAGFGIGAPASRMYGDAKLTQDIGGQSLVEFLEGSASAADKENARRQFIEGLDVDCMLANWSCVGGNSEKGFAVIRDGRVYRTGSYAAMSYRVKGGEKNDDAWGANPGDFFKMWKMPNQEAVIGNHKVDVLGLMKKAVSRDWSKPLAMMSDKDRKIVEKRIENLKKIISFGEERKEEDPDITAEDLSNEMERFMNNRYVKPKKLSIPKPTDEKRVQMESTNQLAKYKTAKEIRKHFSVSNFKDSEVLEKAMKEDGADGLPEVCSSMDELKEKCEYVGYRTTGADSVEEAEKFINDLLNGDFFVKCVGGNVHGNGMYVAMAHAKNDSGLRDAKRDSNCYGEGAIRIEFHIGTREGFKWIEEDELKAMRRKEPEDIRIMDIGNYCKMKGYDGLYSMRSSGSYSYSVIVNRTKCVISSNVKILENSLM